MSLLLEALKKAEKAKEEAQRRSQGGDSAAAMPLSIVGGEEPAEGKRVMTRDELPSISAPLEILSEDLSGKSAATAEPSAERPARSSASAPRQRDPQASERAAARNVFEAKFREPNPRMPFYITMALLGVFAVGTVGYFWYQLRPTYPLVNANPPPPGSEPQVAVSQIRPAALQPVATASAGTQIPGLPAVHPGQQAPAPQAAPPVDKPAVSKTPAIPRPAPAPRPVQARIQPRGDPERPVLRPATEPFSVARPGPQVHPKVESGYAAYLAGDLARARADYDQALREDAGNRDALLGAAAVDVRTGRYESAEATYLRLLQADPRDAHAQAGLIALRGARIDPVSAESRVKSMLAADPAAHVLNFTLGNQLAQQGRWAEAQQQYFKAFAADPDNADFAYNVAVSLDHMRQQALALEYYQRAIALAEKRGASFDVAGARSRAAKLGK
jgi:tetratricopeptide (TPR) repeat protein